MGKLIQYDKSYTGVSAKKYIDLIGTLQAGETTLVLHSASLTVNSTVSIFTSKYNANPANAILGDHSITLTFIAQTENIDIKVRIWDEFAGEIIYPDGNEQGRMAVSEMADSVRKYREGGLIATHVVVYTHSDVPVET